MPLCCGLNPVTQYKNKVLVTNPTLLHCGSLARLLTHMWRLTPFDLLTSVVSLCFFYPLSWCEQIHPGEPVAHGGSIIKVVEPIVV